MAGVIRELGRLEEVFDLLGVSLIECVWQSSPHLLGSELSKDAGIQKVTDSFDGGLVRALRRIERVTDAATASGLSCVLELLQPRLPTETLDDIEIVGVFEEAFTPKFRHAQSQSRSSHVGGDRVVAGVG
jgi:hypothetical protein